jgi:hypothetical protein
MQMPFGKHAGKELAEVPTAYLLWILRARRHLDPALKLAIWRVLEDRGCSQPAAGDLPHRVPPPIDWAWVIRQWYRGLVLDFHPDRGGSHAAMQAINEAHERLRKLVGL